MDYMPYEDEYFFDALGMRVWERRHQFASEILINNNCQKILDIGCSEALFLQRMSRNTDVTLLAGLDIDDLSLESAYNNILPEPIQENQKKQRKEKLVLQLYKGDATKRSQALKNLNFDAITLIEMIEHIELYQLPIVTQNVFGFLNPRIILVTTPNADFNIYFKQNDLSFKFRHPDHRYEMSRDEFTSWASKTASQYGYDLHIDGVCLHKSLNMKYGHCSQIAVFYRKDYQVQSFPNLEPENESSQLICNVPYPFDDRTVEQKIMALLVYKFYVTDIQDLTDDEDKWIYGLEDNIRVLRFDDVYTSNDIIELQSSRDMIIKTLLQNQDKYMLVEFQGNNYFQVKNEEQNDSISEEKVSIGSSTELVDEEPY